jgi:transcription-repair coupling factor (superfamily II helicase)
MLDRAVQALKDGVEFDAELPTDSGPQIDLGLPSLLPSDYVPDVHMRLMLYKRISNAENRLELKEIEVELIDRFGLLPESAKNLLKVAKMKLSALAMGIGKIDAGKNGGRVEFTPHTSIDPGTLIMLIQLNPATYHFNAPENKLRFKCQSETAEERFEFIFAMLDALSKKTTQ